MFCLGGCVGSEKATVCAEVVVAVKRVSRVWLCPSRINEVALCRGYVCLH